jgi:hypothetical protein
MSNPLEQHQDPDASVEEGGGGEDYATNSSTAAAALQNDTNNKWAKNGFGSTRQQTGKFSKEESTILRRAVEDFCAMKQISVARLCSECDHKAELKGAWMEIAKRLPHRSVQSVYRHGLRQLHPFKRGGWTEEECETLVDMVSTAIAFMNKSVVFSNTNTTTAQVQRMGKKWASIQQKLNRSADSCRDKYREMNDDYVKGRWKENESEILKRLIREHLNGTCCCCCCCCCTSSY